MELRQVSRDAQLIARYEVLGLSLTEHLHLLAEADVRLVLLAIAEAVARRLKEGHRAPASRWGFTPDDERLLAAWLRILAPEGTPGAPADLNQVFARLKDLNAAIRSDEQTRQDILQGARFRPQHVRDLVSALVLLLNQKVHKDVLLVVDDGDKVGAESIFVRDLSLLME